MVVTLCIDISMDASVKVCHVCFPAFYRDLLRFSCGEGEADQNAAWFLFMFNKNETRTVQKQ